MQDERDKEITRQWAVRNRLMKIRWGRGWRQMHRQHVTQQAKHDAEVQRRIADVQYAEQKAQVRLLRDSLSLSTCRLSYLPQFLMMFQLREATTLPRMQPQTSTATYRTLVAASGRRGQQVSSMHCVLLLDVSKIVTLVVALS